MTVVSSLTKVTASLKASVSAVARFTISSVCSGDRDGRRAGVLEREGHAEEDVGERVRLALERAGEPLHREVGVLAGLRGLDGEVGVVVENRDGARRAGVGRDQLEPVVGAAAVPRFTADAVSRR